VGRAANRKAQQRLERYAQAEETRKVSASNLLTARRTRAKGVLFLIPRFKKPILLVEGRARTARSPLWMEVAKALQYRQ
jgi:hypothetical protein